MTDQSGAFPEARTAWDSLIDVVTAYVNDRPVPGGDSDRAVVLAAIERARAALERPRPAPPKNHALTLAQTLTTKLADAVTRHVGCNTEIDALVGAIGDALEIAADRGGSAGTGAAPPDSVESLVTWLNANDWWDFSTVELATCILKRLRGGAAPPEPSEKAIEAALNSFAFRKTEGLGGKPWLPHDIIDALKAAYAIDRGGAAQPPRNDL